MKGLIIMNEIHILRSKKLPNIGYRVEKDAYEKYGIACSLYSPDIHIKLNEDKTGLTYAHTGIEKILYEKCLFEPSAYCPCEETPIDSSMPFTWSWTLPENEIVNIAAQHDIKLVFEDQLSLHKDFMNPANAVNVTLLADSSDAPCYTFIQDYYTYIESFVKTNILIQIQTKMSSMTKDISQLTPEDVEQNDKFNHILEKTKLGCQTNPFNYDAGYRIMTALEALGGEQQGYDCEITYNQKIDDAFIARAKAEQNLNITVKQISLDDLNEILNHVSDSIINDTNLKFDF